MVEDQEQVDKLLEIREQCPQLTHICYDDPRGLRNYGEPGLVALDALIAAGRACMPSSTRTSSTTRSPRARPHDVAAMFFTSGTTGNPRAWCTPTAR